MFFQSFHKTESLEFLVWCEDMRKTKVSQYANFRYLQLMVCYNNKLVYIIKLSNEIYIELLNRNLFFVVTIILSIPFCNISYTLTFTE